MRDVKNVTLKRVSELLLENNRLISVLKSELAANTQAVGLNTIAVESITCGLKELAKQTGEWRNDDKEHHAEEGKLNKEKVELMKSLKCLFEADPEKGIKRTC